jgi:hypothetical protein
MADKNNGSRTATPTAVERLPHRNTNSGGTAAAREDQQRRNNGGTAAALEDKQRLKKFSFGYLIN